MSTRPLVRFPTPRQAPDHVVGRLRDVDPTADLVYLGLGQWVLGSVRPNGYRARKARKLRAGENDLPAQKRRPGIYLLTALLEQGFRPVAVYGESEVQSQYVVRDFRERDWNYRTRPEAAFRAAMDRSDRSRDVEARVAAILDKVHADFPTIHRHTFGGRSGVLNPGLN